MLGLDEFKPALISYSDRRKKLKYNTYIYVYEKAAKSVQLMYVLYMNCFWNILLEAIDQIPVFESFYY